MKRKWKVWLFFLFLVIFFAIVACDQQPEPAVVTDVSYEEPTPLPQQVISIVTEPPVDNEKLKEMNDILRRATYLEGVRINGVSVGGMTIKEASAAVADAVAESKKQFAVSIRDGKDIVAFSGAEMTVNDNLEDVLNEAFNKPPFPLENPFATDFFGAFENAQFEIIRFLCELGVQSGHIINRRKSCDSVDLRFCGPVDERNVFCGHGKKLSVTSCIIP